MDNRITSLTPATQALAQKLIDACAAAGVPIKITSTLRTAEEQDRLYAQGRTAPGQIVTKLKGGQGIHETGQAFDVMPVNGGYSASQATWNKIGEIGQGLGLEWGGAWKNFKDLPHFQLKGAKAGKPPVSAALPAQPGASGPTPAPSEAAKSEQPKSGQVYLVKGAPPIPNRLHDYPTYIYSLSLHLLDEKTYNSLVISEKYIPKNVLIASAGRYSESFQRNKHFSEDFYFNDFNLNTIISPNDYSRNSNAVDMTFTIIEPYGFTLIERIIAAAEDLNSKNYLMMPYLIQIDFFAIDEAGNLKGAIPELQKRIPIQIVTLDASITEKGAEYTVTAAPYNHEAFKSSTVTVPINIEVTAKSVADFFQSIEGTASDKYLQDLLASDNLQQRQRDNPSLVANNVNPLLYNSQGTKSSVSADSLGSALNAYWQAQVVNKKAEVSDVYRFEFLPDPDTGQDLIGSATFVDPSKNTPKETPMNADSISMKLSDIGSSQNIYDTTRAIFSINYGTAIDRVLEYVIRNSSYIHDQLNIPDGASQEAYQARKEELKDKPLKWFRITSKVRLIGYDNIRKCFAKEITYVIKPYKMYNVRSDLAPQGIAVSPVKNYNYIFTGKNDDIINLDIKFNFTYFDQQTSDRSNLVQTSPIADSYAEEYHYQNAPNYTGGDPPKGANYNSVMPLAMKPIARNTRATSAGNPSDVRSVASADLAESLMSNTQEDMVVVYLTILGDPDFIKQDELYYLNNSPIEQQHQTTIDPRLLPNNSSLVMDDGGVYVQVLFKVPRDIDDSSGFMKYDANERNSVFSGLYFINTVKSEFSQGKFTQELELVRLPRQIAFDYVGGNNNTTSERPAETAGSNTLGVTVDAPTPPSESVTGGGAAASTADAADSTTNQTPGQDQPAAQANNATPPAESQEQKDLKAVKDTAPVVAISDQNQTPPNPPEPKPTEAKKAAENAFNEFSRNPPQAVRDYDAAKQRIQTINDDIEIREKNIERTNLRLARSDVPDDARKRFNELLVENQTSIDFKRGLLAKEQAIVDANQAANEEFQTKKNELRHIRDNTA